MTDMERVREAFAWVGELVSIERARHEELVRALEQMAKRPDPAGDLFGARPRPSSPWIKGRDR